MKSKNSVLRPATGFREASVSRPVAAQRPLSIWVPATFLLPWIALVTAAQADDLPNINFEAPTTCNAVAGGYDCTTPLGSDTANLTVILNAPEVVNKLTANVSGTVDFDQSQAQTVVVYQGIGAANNYPNTTQGSWNNGPAITLNASDVDIKWSNGTAVPYGGAVLVTTQGAAGSSNGVHNQAGDTSDYKGGIGGDIVIGFSGSIELDGLGGVSSLSGAAIAPTLAGIGAYSLGGAGGAYNSNNDCCAGGGGGGGTVTVTIASGSKITIDGPSTGVLAAGIAALSVGGQAADVNAVGNSVLSAGGLGGTVMIAHQGTITSTAADSIGILAASIGGTGLASNGVYNKSGGASDVTVGLAGSTIEMDGQSSVGVLAASTAGSYSVGFGDDTPAGADVTVTVDSGSSISATGGGQISAGILAVSSGTAAIFSPVNLYGTNSANGSVATSGGGLSGNVTVTNAAPITTSGTLAVGIGAISTGGAAILANASGSGLSYLGNSGTGYGTTSGNVSLTNSGTIQTTGDNAHGLVAISTGGGGLIVSEVTAHNNGQSWTDGMVVGGATDGQEPSGHDGGKVTLTNSGSIETGVAGSSGTVAIGVVAQSIGGGGGTSSGTALFVGDNGGGGGSGGDVTATNSGTISTNDIGALGVLAQSIGGGGGNGANAAGVFVAVGGVGGNGGDGGNVVVQLQRGKTSTGATTGDVTTSGHYAGGVIAQSIGGGGGHGGYADAAGVFITATIGGNGGGAGFGQSVEVDNGAALVTTGNQSLGILAQSIGGGGGNGGVARGTSEGVGADATLALGGAAGGGGAGGVVSVTNTGRILTGCANSAQCQNGSAIDDSYANAGGPQADGADSIGILAQSIGGGGGNGGGASAKSDALAADGIPTFSADYAMGGKGGGGGSGNTVSATNDGLLGTGGDGAFGVLAQSIGAGGGNGGDSTTSSLADGSDMLSFTAAVSVGGSGNVGGSGDTVSVVNGDTAKGQIYTFGQNATGILAQSIGGGGGNGGLGNSSGSLNDDDDDNDSSRAALLAAADEGDDDESSPTSIGVSIGIGGAGAGGGNGGTVKVSNGAGSAITTVGSGSQGILAQSIGGGGGNGAGGSVAADGDDYTFSLAVGGKGGTAGSGGDVTVTNNGGISTGATYESNGAVATTGGDGVGILAQSIGGGGGNGGTSDPSASDDQGGDDDSDDDAGSTSLLAAESGGSDDDDAPANTYTASIGIGGSGGASGSGGAVQVTNGGESGSIHTRGIRAYGILAQSIGGGGGTGGGATSSSNDDDDASDGTYSATLGIGGKGGASGNGGTVDVDNTGAITTSGYAAHGIVAQSIGGGGGLGAEGTGNNSTSVTLGAQIDNGQAASGQGAKVTIDDVGSIQTAGDDAYGVLAQSIGGGGGLGSAGCSNSAAPSGATLTATACFGNSSANGSVEPWSDNTTVNVTLGAAGSASGNGGDIALAPGTGTIVTTGARAFGIAAQSIGGGGGLLAADAHNLAGIESVKSDGGSGGNISIALGINTGAASDMSIATHGVGAFAVFAQSVGGGGGFVGDSSLGFALQASNTNINPGGFVSNGGELTIDLNAMITTSGANAHGIFAQSLGGGGLLAGEGTALRTLTSNAPSGFGGQIAVTQSGGSIKTSGDGSIGVFAQSSGNLGFSEPISIDINGEVVGGTGSAAAGVMISGGSNSASAPNMVTIGSAGSLSTFNGATGSAIVAGYGVTHVINDGTVTGAINLGTAATTATGRASSVAAAITTGSSVVNNGILNAGPEIVAASVTNAGTLDVGGSGNIAKTTVTGDVTQTSAGELRIDLDSLTAAVDELDISGTAIIAGRIVPVAKSLLPGTVTPVTAGALTLSATASPTPGFDWKVARQGNAITLTPTAHFGSAGLGLNDNQGELADHLQSSWDRGGSRELAPLYGALSDLGSNGEMRAAFDRLAPTSLSTNAIQQTAASRAALSAALSCPVFAEAGTTLLGEDRCVWAKITAGQENLDASSDQAGFRINRTTYRAGLQGTIAPDWYLGATAAYNDTSSTSDRPGARGNGQAGDFGVALKHVRGPLQLGAAIDLGYGWYDDHRYLTIGGLSERLESEPEVLTVAGRLRAAYELPFAKWYLRPYADLDMLYSHVPGYDEKGAESAALKVRSQDRTSFAFSPMMELGGRYDAPYGLSLRPYVAAGVTLPSDDTWSTRAELAGAPDGSGDFSTETKMPNVLANLDLGLQVYQEKGLELKLELSFQAGDDYHSQSGSARVAYHF